MTRLEPILRKTPEKHKPRRLARQAVLRPVQKTLCIFFAITPAEIFLIWKRVFLVGSPAAFGDIMN
jgi:hypothetical protein